MLRHALVCCSLLLGVAGLPAAELFDALPARHLGPATMGGRVCDIEVVDKDPRTFYIAAATGGLWKTSDGGDTWKPLFDEQGCLGIGDVAVAPSNPDIIWVGTGEANPRNSVSWGDGVYKSVDGGKSWQHMGLKESHHVGRIIVHPKDPNIVWVAALGHLWGPNKERGLYKTTDGGKNWHLSKFIDENTGFIDLAIDPGDPETLYAAAWQVRRGPYSGGNPATGWGPGSGLFKTDDGGKSWNRMSAGLPTRPLGRCGLAIYRKDPKVVYAVVQTDRTSAQASTGREDKEPETGGIFRSEDRGKTWTKLNSLCPRPFYYGQIRVDPADDRRVYVLGVRFHVSDDGGKTFPTALAGARNVHPDHHALWINPSDPSHLLLGNDGGLYVSKDRGKNWTALRGLPLAQFYGVAVDSRKPYRVYGGLQDNGSWGGPSATDSTEGITINHWSRVGSADGFRCQVDPDDPDTLYFESQYGNLQRRDLKTNRSRSLRPQAGRGKPSYRFNWNAPMLLSPHDSKTLYYGGNHFFKSVDRGDRWEVLGPDLTRGQPGPDRESGHTLTAMAESPVKAGVFWAGSDDGMLHVSKDGGKNWIDLSKKLPGPQERWITGIECSHVEEGTAYVSLDRHRQDDRKPYLYRTTDHGQTWTALTTGLPAEAPVHVVRGSSRNRDLLFAGTEAGLYCSLDAGKSWRLLNNGLPRAVIVHDLVIHPRERELVVATHARGIYVMDVGPLEELTTKARQAELHLCSVRPIAARPLKAPMTAAPASSYRAPNPPAGALIHYHTPAETAVTLTISDASGQEVARLDGPKGAGLQRVSWDLKPSGKPETVAPGEYTLTLRAGKSTATGKITVEAP